MRRNRTGYRVLLASAALAAGSFSNAEAGKRHRAATLLERAPLTDSLVHYVYSLRLGDGPYDEVRVHRVTGTDETLPEVGNADGRRRDDRGIEQAVFLVHGLSGSFTGGFLAGTLPSADTEDQSLAVYLAKQGIDVWGIDLAWSLVPLDVEDVSFMADWGMQRQIDDISAALDFARWKRGSDDRMHLLGYSLGGVVGYAVVNHEAGLGCADRQVKGWIPLDTAFKSEDPATLERACMAAEANEALLADGVFRDGISAGGILIGTLARTDPNGPSPIAPGLTNHEFGLVVAALPQPAPPGADNPFYHFFAGVLDLQTGLPVDLAHVTAEFAFEWLQSLGGDASIALLRDASRTLCGDPDSPFDDHLSDVTLPVLYVGADGAFGDAGIYATTLLGSTDVSVEIVDLVPNDRLLDYGHIDIGSAPNARFLAWDAIADWIQAHDGDPCHSDH